MKKPQRLLITGANGYIGQRLIPALLEAGHELYCCVRQRSRFAVEHLHPRLHLLEIDFSHPPLHNPIPQEIDAAYYLMHSMSDTGNFIAREKQMAENFLALITATSCQQIIYLSGMANNEQLSRHLYSRKQVEDCLRAGPIAVTTLRAGIIVGSGSASFEIIRDLVEKLPVMIAPRWLRTPCQPIAIRNVIQFLSGVLLQPVYYHQDYDIAGPDVLSYQQMLLGFAKVRGLKRWIGIVPVMTPRLSSYWLYFVTSTNYSLAVNLVSSMKVPVVARPNSLADDLNIRLIGYEEAVSLAFAKIEQGLVLSSWKDSFSASGTPVNWLTEVQVPSFGCFKDIKWRPLGDAHPDEVIEAIWKIGGDQGWYYGNWLWGIRGLLDKMAGGVGLRRGRRSATELNTGDALDFWRVLVADKQARRLLLFAEMKLPGEAWLEFKIMRRDHALHLRQTATFRPKGLWGRMYWFSVLPFHFFIFNGMIRNILREACKSGPAAIARPITSINPDHPDRLPTMTGRS